MDRGVIPGLPLHLQVVGRIARKHGFNGLLKALPTDANSVLPIQEKELEKILWLRPSTELLKKDIQTFHSGYLKVTRELNLCIGVLDLRKREELGVMNVGVS